jgi:uncharacterized protein YdeI (YjbR/CyaY-like superfamily)
MAAAQDFPIVPFASGKEWEAWLEKNHETATGVWMQFYKKATGLPSISWADAIPIALCYGWIDSQAKAYDEKSYLQKFTPRGPKSIWSKINVAHVEQLIKEGKMKPAGLAAVEAAKKDGRWDKAYDSPKNMTVPEDFLKELEKHKKAKAFFATLNKANTYAIAWRLQTAKKPETRERRMQLLLEKLERGEKLH